MEALRDFDADRAVAEDIMVNAVQHVLDRSLILIDMQIYYGDTVVNFDLSVAGLFSLFRSWCVCKLLCHRNAVTVPGLCSLFRG